MRMRAYLCVCVDMCWEGGTDVDMCSAVSSTPAKEKRYIKTDYYYHYLKGEPLSSVL